MKFNIDAWRNIVTGARTTKDKKTYSEVVNWEQMDEDTCQSLFSGDEIARKCASLIPTHATREGVTFGMDETADSEEVLKFLDLEYRRLNITDTLREAWISANVFGGACILMVVDDGSRKLSSPLNPEKVKKLKSLRVFNRWEMQIKTEDIVVDMGSPHYGRPLYYYYQPNLGTKDFEMVKIHHTRMLRFDGVALPRRLYVENGYWDDTVYKSLYDAIRNYGTMQDELASMLQDYQTPLYRIHGLAEALTQDEDELVIKRVQIAQLTKSLNRALVLDKEDEFQNISMQLNNVDKVSDMVIQRLVTGMDVPRTVFMGVSPSGLSGTGYSEMMNFYDTVKALQSKVLRNPYEELTELLFGQDEVPVSKPEGLTIIFNTLFQQDRETEEKSRLLQAQVDQAYITAGVLSKEEVTQSRYGTGMYSYETTLDDAAGERVSAQEQKPVSIDPNGRNKKVEGTNQEV